MDMDISRQSIGFIGGDRLFKRRHRHNNARQCNQGNPPDIDYSREVIFFHVSAYLRIEHTVLEWPGGRIGSDSTGLVFIVSIFRPRRFILTSTVARGSKTSPIYFSEIRTVIDASIEIKKVRDLTRYHVSCRSSIKSVYIKSKPWEK